MQGFASRVLREEVVCVHGLHVWLVLRLYMCACGVVVRDVWDFCECWTMDVLWGESGV